MFLNKHNLAIAALASKDQTRYALHGLHITPTETAATDGHCLGRVTLPDFPRGDFPVVGVEESDKPFAPCIIPKDAADRLAKQLPKKASIPILENALVDIERSQGDTFRAVTTDRDTTQPLEVSKVEGEFPTLDNVMPTGEPVLTVGFNALLLAQVLKVAGSITDSQNRVVKLEFFDQKYKGKQVGPVKITCQNVHTGQTGTFLVMTCQV